MTEWVAFDHRADFAFGPTTLRTLWPQLHAGDREPFPQEPALLAGWAAFHEGAFEQAFQSALELGEAGWSLAHKAQWVYATLLEPKEKLRQKMLLEVVERAAAHCAQSPQNANAHYWRASALARYSQSISVAKALALGLGNKIRTDLETAIGLDPRHADAHVALGSFHADVIDKVGTLIARMTYGARKETCLRLFELALQLTPTSASTLTEYAHALVILEGDARADVATGYYAQAAQAPVLDAQQRLEHDLVQAERAI